MISYIRGELVAVEKDKIVVDVNGVGWGIYMPEQTMGRLPSIGEEVKIHTYLNVREDAMQLYGFCTRDDLEIFKLVNQQMIFDLQCCLEMQKRYQQHLELGRRRQKS